MSTPSPSLAAPGDAAPAFDLSAGPDRRIALSDFRGRPVVLVFYPADWSSVCGDQIAVYNEMSSIFAGYNVQLLGISVDGMWCHQAFQEARRIQFPLLADFQPRGEVARRYGVYRENDGITERALFVIDAAGIVRWSYLSPIGENPGADGIIAALDALTPEQLGTPAASGEARA